MDERIFLCILVSTIEGDEFEARCLICGRVFSVSERRYGDVKKNSATKLHIRESPEHTLKIEVNRLIKHANEEKSKYKTDWIKEYSWIF